MADPVTLGEKLRWHAAEAAPESAMRRSVSFGAILVRAGLITLFMVLVLWWLSGLAPNDETVWAALAALGVVWVVFAFWSRPGRRRRPRLHFLLAGDRIGFMEGLRLDEKTAVIDGSNLYHFGLSNQERVLYLMVKALRAEGYRVVCFFDANIFHTLQENGAFPADQRHSLDALTQHFGLVASEIYIVPARVQADKYILSTLTHLPISFAVTNDRFRDYGKTYGAVMKGDQWRKGVTIKGNELRLTKYRFKTPIRLNGAGRS